MRGAVTKKLRKEARIIAANNPTRYREIKGQIRTIGYRAIYQGLKEEYKTIKRG